MILSRLSAANVQVEWIHEDATTFSLKKKFDTAIGWLWCYWQ